MVCQVGVELLEEAQIEPLDEGDRGVGESPIRVHGGPDAMHRCFCPVIVAAGCRPEVIAKESELYVVEVPAIVHGRSQQTLGTDHVEEQADDLLAWTGRSRRVPPRRLEVIDDGNAVPDHRSVR